MPTPAPYKKLIEVAMPVKEVSAESVRDKSIRHGHISTLHLWWARRPLPVCRAVVFASLVPDPDDAHCPPAFKAAVAQLLGPDQNPGDPYRPYDDIPYTAAVDSLPDTLRNRLLMFVGKFSDKFAANEKTGRKTNAKEQLAPASLVRWESKNDPAIIGRARRLIWVAHNALATPPPPPPQQNAENEQVASYFRNELAALLADYDQHDQALRTAEQALYSYPNRHQPSPAVAQLETELHAATEAFLDRMPRVFDPFAGGGAIPLEAARLGCRAFGNDINPVAHIIQRASLEFPQRFGKPITYSYAAFVARYGKEEYAKQHAKQHVLDTSTGSIRLANRLAFDVEFFARRLLARAEAEIGHFYPADEKGRKPIAYYWARVGTCANPSCRAEVPLLKQFYLVNKPGKQVYLDPVISGSEIHFRMRNGECASEGWVSRGNFKCPCCNNPTDVTTLKAQFIAGQTKERLLAVIMDGANGKEYRLPTPQEISVAAAIPTDVERPTEQMPVKYTQALPCCTWGIASWGDLFASRQILMLNTLTDEFAKLKQELSQEPEEFGKALIAYLAILIDRLAIISTSFGIWHTGRETVERPMGRQAIPMVFDYPESNPFCDSTGSAANQIDWITRYIESESVQPFAAVCHNASSGDVSQFAPKYLTAVVTDPPYYDAIAYADISDFFYVWLKRTLSDTFPLNFAFPQTPKTEECTALKHHHAGNNQKAITHFEQKLQQIFSAIERQTCDVVSIMFAHQSTEAWTTLCNSILGASMNITGSWANDTEMMGALKTDKAFLSSSVTVACRPVMRQGEGNYKRVRDDIEATVAREVDELYRLGFRGADLLTACFGQAVSVFGQYERVEKSDGTLVMVAELLALARESAFKALLKGFDGDEYTKFYIGWLQLYGLTEADFDDAAKFSRAGLQLNVADLLSHGIFAKKGNKLTLATSAERLLEHKSLGVNADDLLLDQAHRALGLYHRGQRRPLVQHLARVAPAPEQPFWRVLTALGEVLPVGSDDHRLTAGLLADRDSLLREIKQLDYPSAGATGDLFA